MAKLADNIIAFSGGDVKPFMQFRDYYFHYMDLKAGKKLGVYDATVDFAEKEKQMEVTLMSTILKKSGQTMSADVDLRHFSMNPMFQWATFEVVDMMIDAVLPETIIDSIGIYTDIKNVSFGESANFEIKPRSLFTVSQGANAQRTAFINKQFNTTKSLVATNHSFTVQVSRYKILSKEESLAEFVRKAIISMETQMTLDAYNALNTGLSAVTVPAPLKVTGYTQDALLTQCQTVQAYNQGAKPVIVGTTKALSRILPDAAKGYRIVTNSENMGIQLIRNFFDYDILILPQVATGKSDYSLALKDNIIYVVSPTSEKLVKGIVEGSTLTNINDFDDNANLTQNATLNKRWNFEFMSNATASSITLA